MSLRLSVLAFVLALVWGCAPSNEQSAPVTTDAKPAPIEDPAKQQLLPQMSQIAKTTAGDWSTLDANGKKPFLDFHSQDEELVRLERDLAAS